VVTLHFGYLEYEVDSFVERLNHAGLLVDMPHMLTQKLAAISQVVEALDSSAYALLKPLLAEVDPLIRRRNELVHGCLLTRGRVISAKPGVAPKSTSVEELTALSESVANWKERLNAFKWKQVEPLLNR
jgi:hypothetical protein